jgi:hypothetical protein
MSQKNQPKMRIANLLKTRCYQEIIILVLVVLHNLSSWHVNSQGRFQIEAQRTTSRRTGDSNINEVCKNNGYNLPLVHKLLTT